MKRKLKELFSDELYLDFVDKLHVKEEKIIDYIHRWPDKFYSLFLKIQRTKKKSEEFILPEGNGTLKFKINTKTKKIDVYFKRTSKKDINKRFKELLKEAFVELKNEKNYDKEMSKIFDEYTIPKSKLKEIDRLIKYI